jgi:hypothetical protein
MRLSSLFPKLTFLIAILPSNKHRSENHQRRTNVDNINASTTPPPPPPPPPSPLPLAPRTPGYTDPLIPTHPTLLYATATAYHVISGVTLYTTYTDLISGTHIIPFTSGTELNLSALRSTTTTSKFDTSLVFPVEPSVPPGSLTPTLDLGRCSTATGGGEGVRACGDGVVESFNGAFGGGTLTSSGGGVGLGPTKTVTEPYFGAEVAKGEATWVVGAQGSGGLRVRGRVGERGDCGFLIILGGWMVVWVFGLL